ncbi:MAG: HAD hydrolase family protein [Pseudomonadales bacterium]|jgi:3-deoxy-D-manno-octulosonate 8-phosphate phosphatase (KDO 8-P phosphatase)|nr:HAD hydrolase family protein [Pseudomonadales bacterium]MBP9032650.1 HAD hydrolase family protein [Pseudomonadales bacterium]
MTEELKAIARRIRLLALDVDGVLTDGRIHYSGEGEEMKSFSILDGLGIKLVRHCGIQVAIITARRSGAVERRARELGIDHCVQGREDKLEALRELLAGTGLTLAETAYMGDDLPDLRAIMAAGLGMTVANASSEVACRAAWQSSARGGDGAVREACEMLLRARDQWARALATYLPGADANAGHDGSGI